MIKFESEKHLEDFICENLDENICLIDNIDFDTYQRQYRCGDYGIADIVVFNRVEVGGKPEILEIYIYELKNERFSIKSLAQVARYQTYFQRVASEIYPNLSISTYSAVVCLDDGLTDDEYVSNVDDFSIPIYKYSICPINGFSIQLASGVKLKEESLSECEHISNLMGV